MRHIGLGVIAIAANIAGPMIAHAQSGPSTTASQTIQLPASLSAKKLSDTILRETNGNIDAILATAGGDTAKLTTVTESTIFTIPASVSEIVGKATQGNLNDGTAIGLGLCMATSNLMNAAGNPTTPPDESQSLRNFARSILANVAAASQTSATSNGISTSFGISVNDSGGTSITCKSISGEVVATASVNAASASSTAGVGMPTNTGEDGAFLAASAPEDASGGGQRHISYSAGRSGRLFSALELGSAGQTTIAVPGPEAGAGLLPLAGLGAYIALRIRRSKRLTT